MHAHEAFIRTPADCPWRNPDELFAAARIEGRSIELEIECVRLALRDWASQRPSGRLFLNLSAQALAHAFRDGAGELDGVLRFMHGLSLVPEGLVIELTEHERVHDVDALARAVERLRRLRVAVALDDFGDGRSSLRLWSELKPEIVKIDMYFTRDLATHPEKLQTLRALIQIAQIFGTSLVAEGIESPQDLLLVRDLGIDHGQGWVFGRPARSLCTQLPDEAVAVLRTP